MFITTSIATYGSKTGGFRFSARFVQYLQANVCVGILRARSAHCPQCRFAFSAYFKNGRSMQRQLPVAVTCLRKLASANRSRVSPKILTQSRPSVKILTLRSSGRPAFSGFPGGGASHKIPHKSSIDGLKRHNSPEWTYHTPSRHVRLPSGHPLGVPLENSFLNVASLCTSRVLKYYNTLFCLFSFPQHLFKILSGV